MKEPTKKTKKPARGLIPTDEELRAIIKRGRRAKPDEGPHRIALEYALAVVAAGCDPSRVPYPTRTVH